MADAAAVPSHLLSIAPMAGRVCVPPGNGAGVPRCVNPVGTLEGVPEAAFSSLLNLACNWKFVFLCIFPNNELEHLGVDGASKKAESVQPLPRPCVEGDTCCPSRTFWSLLGILLFVQMAGSPFSQRWKTRRGSDFWSRLGTLCCVWKRE